MLSKLKRFIHNNVNSNTLPILRSDWERIHAQNATLRSKIDEADHIIKRQKDAIMIEQRKNTELMDSLCNDILPPVPIQLKGRTLIVIQGLPAEMTVEEANYISGILASYALRPELAIDALHASEPNGIGK